ncbi:MAG: alpha/beta hydrolase [Parcubacteria group bacterium]|nr:alpha/beta hydrolase [Parcubacteria group bacterium]
MKTVFMFHGTAGYPEENWFPWLKEKLEVLGYNVIIPQFPTPENQSPESWFEVFNEHREFYNTDTILIGHSLGGTFLLRVLEKYNIKIKAAHFVAASIGVMPIKNYETDKPFIIDSFDWDKIRNRAERFSVFHSDDDPYVSLDNGKQLTKHLKINLTFIPNSGHFNKKAGYLKFEELLEEIKEDTSEA